MASPSNTNLTNFKSNSRGAAFPDHSMKIYSSGTASLSFNLALDGGEWPTSLPCHFIPVEEHIYPLH